MTVTIVACGESARHWVPRGLTIGVNDALKFGIDTDILLLVNAPVKFKERLSIIKKSKAEVLTTGLTQWKPFFQNAKRLERVTSFNKMIMKGFCQTSQTSPIMAMSHAIRLGATELIVWGIDFVDHRVWRVGTKSGDREIAKYKLFFKECERLKIKVWRGADGTVFDNVLPLWQ